MTKEELKEWLKANLVIETEYVYRYEPRNDVRVQLRFVDEEREFTSDIISIPDDRESPY